MLLVNTIKSIKAETFSIENFYRYTLILQVLPCSLNYAVFEKDSNTYLVFEQFEFNGNADTAQFAETLRILLEQAGLNNVHPAKSIILWHTAVNTIIPKELYNESQLDTYLNFVSTLEDFAFCCSDYLKTLDAYLVYSIPASAKQLIESSLPGIKFMHNSTALIENILVNYKRKDKENTVIVNVEHSFFNVLVVKGKKMVYSNTFNYSSVEDCLYFVLFVYEHLDLNAEQIPIHLFGLINKDDGIYQLLFKYFRYIEFGERGNAFKLNDAFNELPEHGFYNLFNALLCE